MKFKTISFVIFSLSLTACTAQPAASTSTSAPSKTPIFIPAATPVAGINGAELTPAPVVETAMDKLNIIFTDTQELNVSGVTIIGSTSVDESARSFDLNELTIDPNTLDDLSARALHSFFVPGSTDTNAEAAAWLKECKTGTPMERTETVHTTANPNTPELLEMVMDCGQVVPDGSVGIKGVEIIYGKWYVRAEGNNGGVYGADPEMPWLSIVFRKSGTLSGLLVDKDSGLLKVFVGMPFNTNKDILLPDASTKTEIAIDWLARYPRGLTLTTDSSQYNQARNWMSSMKTK